MTCREGEHEGNQNRLVEHEPQLGSKLAVKRRFGGSSTTQASPSMGILQLCMLIVVCRGDIIRSKREGSLTVECIVLVEERVDRLPLTHHEFCLGSCDPSLNGIHLKSF